MFEKSGKLTRRQWLKGVGTAGLGSLLLPTDAMAGIGDHWLASADASGDQLVPTRPFGKTGVNVSMLSLGGMFDIQSNQLLLKQALKWGVSYWDTADCYGRGKSEKGLGKFFSKYPDQRKKVFLVSKSDDRDPEGMTRLLNRSLERMNTDYIDLYFVHGISDIDELNEDTRQWAAQAKTLGKINFFGFSTHRNMETCLMDAAKLGWIDGIMMTYNFRLMHSEKMKKAVDACTRAGIGLTAMKTQGGGTVRTESETELEMAGRFLKEGFTDKQAKLKAVWENPQIASICSQMPNMTILMSNVGAALNKTDLSTKGKRLLEKYARETQTTYCAGCGRICESALDDDVPVSDVMRYMMYHNHYTNQDEARTALARLPKETCDVLTTLDYSKAERQCPQRLEIGKLMRSTAKILG
jgi:predicted aldo/keto reductase-like oxidoreductase